MQSFDEAQKIYCGIEACVLPGERNHIASAAWTLSADPPVDQIGLGDYSAAYPNFDRSGLVGLMAAMIMWQRLDSERQQPGTATVIFTDCVYAYNACSENIQIWKDMKWKRKKGRGFLKNIDLLSKCSILLEELTVPLTSVPQITLLEQTLADLDPSTPHLLLCRMKRLPNTKRKYEDCYDGSGFENQQVQMLKARDEAKKLAWTAHSSDQLKDIFLSDESPGE